MRIVGEATGRPARWEELPREDARRRMLDSGRPSAIVDGALDHLAARIADPERAGTAVEDVTGAPARSPRSRAADHAGLLR
ncbi:hypothetical protein [Kitasatospora terrestris]|uniref:Uncharacterized protein n=1 Tax=Kitasatospora terrestris TaxID=258051 RepID=A0ABP9DQ08_9ACTN